MLRAICQREGCRVHEVVGFIVDRMREDSVSQQIRTIRQLNESHLHEHALVECQRMQWWERVLVCPDHLRTAQETDSAAHTKALAMFGCLVADARSRPLCGQWDYKKEIEVKFDNSQTIDFCSIGCREGVTFYYDIWANIHFGYLGMCGGFDEDILLEGATIEHSVSNLGQSRDDPSDQVAIRIGVSLYRSALTEGSLMRQLYEHRYELNKARSNDQGAFEVYR